MVKSLFKNQYASNVSNPKDVLHSHPVSPKICKYKTQHRLFLYIYMCVCTYTHIYYIFSLSLSIYSIYTMYTLYIFTIYPGTYSSYRQHGEDGAHWDCRLCLSVAVQLSTMSVLSVTLLFCQD